MIEEVRRGFNSVEHEWRMSDYFAIFVWVLSFFSFSWQKSDKSDEVANVNFSLLSEFRVYK